MPSLFWINSHVHVVIISVYIVFIPSENEISIVYNNTNTR